MRRLRLAAEGARQRHPEEPAAAAGRDPRSAPRRAGIALPEIRVAVRTGDTPARERQAHGAPAAAHPDHHARVALHPAHRREEPRACSRRATTVIVDEIHAVAGDKRGAHLALSLERLDALAGRPPAAHRPVGDAEADRGGRAPAGRHRPRHRSTARRAAPSSTPATARQLDLAHRDRRTTSSARSPATSCAPRSTTASSR